MSSTYSNLRVLDHPLAEHFVTLLRKSATQPSEFRVLCKRLTVLLAAEASRDLRMRSETIEGPLEAFDAKVLDESLVAVAILRAGLGMLDPVLELFPDISVGYIGLVRNEDTAIASSYYAKLPPEVSGKTIFLLDPMLATGGSASQACDLIKEFHPARIVMMAVVAAPQGVALMNDLHPDVAIVTAALDRELNSRSYILPGLGDFGDRLYGT